MKNMRTEILQSGIRRLFFRLALPGIIGTLILGLYNFIDGIFVGQFIGPEALGGVTLVYSIVLINQAILTLFGMGAMAVLSIALGKKDKDIINLLFGNVVLTIGILSLILSVIVLLFTDNIIYFLGGRGIVFEYSRDYLKILATGFVFAALGPAVNMLFRGEGHIQQAMKILSAGVFLNIILDFVFIYMLSMGVQGAALATVISQIVLVGLNLLFIAQGNSIITFKYSKFRISPALLVKITGIGSSTMILLLLASVQQMLLFKVLSAYENPVFIPLLGAAYRILLFAVIPFAGIGQGLQSIVGINFGACNFERVKEAFKVFTIYASFIAGAMWLLFIVFPDQLLSMMISDKDIINTGAPYFRLLFLMFPVTGLVNNAAIFFQALGKGGKASLIFLSRQMVFFIPCLIILPKLFGVSGVWLSMPVAEFSSVIIILCLLVNEYRHLAQEDHAEIPGSLSLYYRNNK